MIDRGLGGSGLGAVYRARRELAADTVWALRELDHVGPHRDRILELCRRDDERLKLLGSDGLPAAVPVIMELDPPLLVCPSCAAQVPPGGCEACRAGAIRIGCRHFVQMDFIEGTDLESCFATAKRPPPVDEVVSTIVCVAKALGHIHDHGLVHLDVRPESIVRDADGHVWLVNLGSGWKRFLHEILDRPGAGEGIAGPDTTAAISTGTDRALTFACLGYRPEELGAFGYRPPEQLDGRGDHRSDIYSLGMTLCRLLTGRDPRDPAQGDQILGALHEARALGALNPEIGAHLEQTIRRATASNPADRHRNVDELLIDLLVDLRATIPAPRAPAPAGDRPGAAPSSPRAIAPPGRSPEVDDLRVIADDRQVTLRWLMPAEADEIAVTRKRGGPPASRRDGDPVFGWDPEGVTDTGLTNGQRYGYRICCRTGGDWSVGVTRVVAPGLPPPAPSGVRALVSGQTVFVMFDPPSTGTVRLLRVGEDPGLDDPATFDPTRLDLLGEEVCSTSSSGVRWDGVPDGRTLYLPVAVDGDRATVGAPVRPTPVPEVRDLSAALTRRQEPVELTLRCAPPPGAAVLVAWGRKGFVRASDLSRADGSHRVSGTEAGRMVITLGSRDDRVHLTAFAVFRMGDQEVLSSGQESCCRQLVAIGARRDVRYHVVSKLFGSPRLTLEVDESTRLPRLHLVAREFHTPLCKESGTVWHEIPSMDLEPRARLSIPLPSPPFGLDTRFCLFPADDGVDQWLFLENTGTWSPG